MVTYVNSMEEWPRWNDLIFRDHKDAIVFSMSKNDPRFKIITRDLNTFKKTMVFCLQPREFNTLMKDADVPMAAPCIIGYQDGEAIFNWQSETVGRSTHVQFNTDDIMYELSKRFI